jgi:hypothetical protein
MNFNNYHNSSTFASRVVCAIVFSLFTFFFLYFFQADVLTAAQHILSGGVTHYSRLLGAILITFVLQLLQIAIFSFTHLLKRTHALTYFPSCLILAFITDISPNIVTHFSVGAWIWIIPLMLVVFVGSIKLALELQPYEPENSSNGLFSRNMWINLLILNSFFLFVGLASNGNDIFHYRMRIENLLNKGEFDKAVCVGVKSDKSDASLTMLRIYALSRVGQLGDKLFTYPVKGGAYALIPSDSSVVLFYPSDSIFHYLGGKTRKKYRPMQYMQLLQNRHKLTRPAIDYLLCGYLLDKKLDAFVRELRKYYKIDEKLPLHYREALTLYTHLRTNPLLVYHNSVMDTDYQDMVDLQSQYSNPVLRRSAVLDSYGNTYWSYYLYK